MALGMLGPLLVGALHGVPLRFDLNLILRILLFIFWGGLPLGPPRLGKVGVGVGGNLPWHWACWARFWWGHYMVCHLKFDSNLIFENTIVYFLCVAAPWPPKACISWGGCGWQLAMPLGALAATWVAASLHNIFDVWVFCS